MGRSNTGSSANYFETNGLPIAAQKAAGAPLSCSAWFKPATLGSTSNLTFMIDSGGSYFGITYDGANVNGRGAQTLTVDTGGAAISAGTFNTVSSTSTWSHAVGSRDGSTDLIGVLNGNLGSKANTAFGGTSVALGNNLTIGAFHVTGGGVFSPLNGAVAEVAWWDVVLTDAEMVALSQGVPALLIRPDKLFAYWPMRAGSTGYTNLYGSQFAATPLFENGGMVLADHPPVFSFNPVEFEPQGAAAALSASLVVSPMQTLLNQLLAR